jgi:DNA repair photolyase
MMDVLITPGPFAVYAERMNSNPPKGRGAGTNRTGRFEAHTREAFDDGWDLPEPAKRPVTSVTFDHTRTILTRNDSPDIPFDQSINPYRGCEHGCSYCFARPTHAYLGLSPGLDFETKLLAKPDAAALLRKELGKASYVCSPIALGTNTDPYQPIEREHRITRSILEVCAELHHPISIVTKSANVMRDLDLLSEMAAHNLVLVFLSVTTLDNDLAGRLEPRASRPQRRLAAIAALAEAGVPVGVLSSPMIPGLNDHELEAILAAAEQRGARFAGYTLLRLPLEIKDLFREWLEVHAPDRAARVLALVRQTRDGQLYDARFGVRGRGTGPYAELLARRFALACQRLGLGHERMELDTRNFRRPGKETSQLPLF